MTKNRVALVLAGCGAKDGAEITEAVSLLIAFSQQNFAVTLFAPNRATHHVINHLNNEICISEHRNILTEASRIARGKIQALTSLQIENFDILSFSGGFGVAKNLCNFAFEGEKAKLEDDVKDILFKFIKTNKITSALCIAPILLALAAKELNLTQAQITLGDNNNDASKIVRKWGIACVTKSTNEACIDPINKFVTAPAYMYDNASPADIFASATALVNGIKDLQK